MAALAFGKVPCNTVFNSLRWSSPSEIESDPGGYAGTNPLIYAALYTVIIQDSLTLFSRYCEFVAVAWSPIIFRASDADVPGVNAFISCSNLLGNETR